MNEKVKKTIKEYAIITVSILLMAVGVYFFKFPNNFLFKDCQQVNAIVSISLYHDYQYCVIGCWIFDGGKVIWN